MSSRPPDSDDPRQFWEARYAETPGYRYGTEPNAFLAAQRARVRPGSRWFVPGDGEGRNGVWLATVGAIVTSLDISDAGPAKSRALAAARGVELDARQGDLAAWAPPDGSYDGVASIFCHLPPPLRAAVHATIVRALAPGGLVVIEAFTPKQLEYQPKHNSGGPRSPALLYDAAMLRADFAALEVLSLEEHETRLDEGPLHSGLGFVVSGLFQKPAR